MILGSDTESESDTENKDGLAWKKRKVNHSLDGHQGEHLFAIKRMAYLKVFTVRSQSIAIDETDDEVDGAVKLQSVARVGGNGEWGIHGIIGKEVIGGENILLRGLESSDDV